MKLHAALAFFKLSVKLLLLLLLLLVVVVVVVVVGGGGVVVVVSNIMHTSHVCVTLTSRIYFLLTLAQGKKAAPE